MFMVQKDKNYQEIKYWLYKDNMVRSMFQIQIYKAGKICCDCSGLISSLVGGQGFKNTTWFRNNAIESKPISQRNSSMKGWAVYMQGHIGVYDGNDGYYAMDGSKRRYTSFTK